tara:strand:- start:224 stop:487 length:264 start_codon:yes stop_codon:yes gene_type:complete
MTKLRNTSEKSDHLYCYIKEIESIQVDGNTTYMTVEIGNVITNDGVFANGEQAIIEIETLQLIETFNTTWVNHALGKLRTWLNQLAK